MVDDRRAVCDSCYWYNKDCDKKTAILHFLDKVHSAWNENFEEDEKMLTAFIQIDCEEYAHKNIH